MRLLNTETWVSCEFIAGQTLPPYAILSHTWEGEEVSYQEWESGPSDDVKAKTGYKKIRNFGRRAAADGFKWIWVDT